MHRRALLVSVLATSVVPLTPRAQSPARVFRVGILSGLPNSPAAVRLWEGFLQGLGELGYVEGKNIFVERRYYENSDRLAAFALDLVRLQPDVIVAGASPAPEVARRATSTIPIVMATHIDPVGSGLAVSLSKPGGNVTGTSLLSAELRGKQLELFKQTVPSLKLVAVLVDPSSATHGRELEEIEAAARVLQLRVQVVRARASSDLSAAFQPGRVDGVLIVGGTLLLYSERAHIAARALERGMPTMAGLGEFAAAGCLMSYGPDLAHGYRRAAWYVDQILKGAKAGDLPIEQPTKFALVINVRTAKALRLTIPAPVLARADALTE